RLSGIVLPASSKYLIDEVVIKRQGWLLAPIVIAAVVAGLLQAVTAFYLSQVLGVAAHRAITGMRRKVQAHVGRLPVGYFDSTQTGILISRIVTDADGVRNLVGSGLVQLSGSVVTALISIGVLFYLNWRLTSLTMAVLLLFGGGMAYSFQKLRPRFRE